LLFYVISIHLNVILDRAVSWCEKVNNVHCSEITLKCSFWLQVYFWSNEAVVASCPCWITSELNWLAQATDAVALIT